MSDDWKLFLCTMGDNQASIMVDVGIADGIEHTPPDLVTISLIYKQPDDRGLPAGLEFKAVSAVEDEIQAFVKLARDAYVGRITKEGQRIFFIYTMRAQSRWATFVEQLGERTGYAFELEFERDAEHQNYWEFLYPTPDDWQVIGDMDVVESLRKSGDDPEAKHEIEHWSYFPDGASAQAFVDWATSDRFEFVQEHSGPQDDGRFGVKLVHFGTTYQKALSHHTCALRRKAEEFGGEYDGWGTVAIKGADDGSKADS